MIEKYGRFLKAAEYLKDKGKIHKQRDIATALDMGPQRISDAYNGKSGKFTEHFLLKFADAYSDYISKDWLMDGRGEMAVPDKSLRPHFDVKVNAGFLNGLSEGQMSAEMRAMPVPTLSYDFSIDVNGDSMEPDIMNGDVLYCRLCDSLDMSLLNTAYVIDSKEGAVVKEIADVLEDSIVLHSTNPKYEDYSLDMNDIHKTAKVVGLSHKFD